MKGLKIRKTIPAAVLLITLCGCSTASVEELLSPPRLDGEQTEIYEALRSFTNSDIILKYPRSGQYRSAFVVTDLDNEPTDEAIVFYETPNISDGSSLRMNFLDKQNGTWVSVYDFAASGSEVDSVRFEDLGGESINIIVTYLVQNSTDHYTSIMAYKDGIPEELVNVRNIFMDVFDANGDGVLDVFTITNDRTAGSSVAGIYGSSGEGFGQIAKTRLNSGFAGIKDVVCGAFDEKNTTAVFIDYAFSDGSFGTDAVICTPGFSYLSPVLGPDNIYRLENTYTPYVPCMDIDGDGLIEIPETQPFSDYVDLPDAEKVSATVWYSLDRAGTYKEVKLRSFLGTKGDYMLVFPEKWGSFVTAAVSISDMTVRFNRYNEVDDMPEEVLMTLYTAAEGNTDKYSGSEFVYLGMSDNTGYSYYAKLGTGSRAPTEQELHEMFCLL